MRARPPLALLLAVAGYLVLRALVLHTNFDAVAIPVFELPVMGNLAEIVANGERGEPLARYYDNCGGHIVTGLLAAPLYAAFGSSYLVLKLVPSLLGLVVLVVVWRLLERRYDRRAANLFAFLFAFAPPTLTKYSMLAKGNHFENLAFQVFALVLFLGMHQRGVSPRRLLASAAAAGFALFVYFGSVILIASLALLHVLVRRGRTLRDLPAALAGFALGLSPLLWIQLEAGGTPGGFLQAKVTGEDPWGLPDFGARLVAFFGQVLPRAAVFEDFGPLSGRLAGWLFLACFAVGWAVLALDLGARVRRLKLAEPSLEARAGEVARLGALQALPFLVYLPLFALVISATNFSFAPYAPPVEIGTYRYLVPHFLVATIVIALACAHLLRGSLTSRAAGGALGALALATGLWTLPIVDTQAPETGLGRRYPGHQFLQYSNVSMRFPERDPETGLPYWDPEVLRASLSGISPAHRREAYAGVGHYAAWAVWILGMPGTPAGRARLPLDSLLDSHPPEARVALARGVGSLLRRLLANEGKLDELAAELAALADEGHPLVPWVIEGLCLDVQFPLVHLLPHMAGISGAIALAIPPELLGSYRRGLGTQAGRLLARGLEADREFLGRVLAELPDPHDADFWFGVGWGLAEFEGARNGRAPFDLPSDPSIPPESRAAVLLGIGASLRDLHGPDPPLPQAPPDDQHTLRRGAGWMGYPAPYPI